ncbi:uncharacterized protein MYCGRDRAFT_92672 [Zymoseptoria tritici IPO323]|uniref:Uncharacterized protein n=1 Tax=Zymoseptoria tritici (strain CBS 115943 / IPO323) TaxID=336722 RepID=F9X958_ZYMTI|nr:uncharacterized protein MYCGRDRAFT_92672 [Zymoseptoria tritici IPO323]EGP88035.1 hypothetical protein MYCGRDRAFT_92672 [Zymoseptoria tritici IPO323]
MCTDLSYVPSVVVVQLCRTFAWCNRPTLRAPGDNCRSMETVSSFGGAAGIPDTMEEDSSIVLNLPWVVVAASTTRSRTFPASAERAAVSQGAIREVISLLCHVLIRHDTGAAKLATAGLTPAPAPRAVFRSAAHHGDP